MLCLLVWTLKVHMLLWVPALPGSIRLSWRVPGRSSLSTKVSGLSILPDITVSSADVSDYRLIMCNEPVSLCDVEKLF